MKLPAPLGLTKVAVALAEFDKRAARTSMLSLPRATGYGALAGFGTHVGNRLMASPDSMAGDPSDTATAAAAKSALGGMAIAGLVNLLNRMVAKR